MSRRTGHYEPDREAFPAEAYKLKGDRYAIAWRILGWHVEPDADTEWTGIMERTGDVVAVMFGDDFRHLYDPTDFEPLGDLDFCLECGQVGCTHDGRERAS